MTGRSSKFLSVALTVIGGCYEAPDLEIAVTRRSHGDNVIITVCHVDDLRRCSKGGAFPMDYADDVRTVFVFVDADVPEVWVKLEHGDKNCAKIQLAHQPLQRTLLLEEVTGIPPIWSDETLEPCPSPL